MLTAEGTGRKLNPEANMWLMAKPLIEQWVVSHLGPEARLTETAKDLREGLARLPQLLKNMEQSAAVLADGRIRLHSETIRALKRENRFSFGLTTVALAVALLAALIALALS
jgi:ubiquinone biosynthesis protein